MSANSKLPNRPGHPGVDFEVALLSQLLDCVEAFARRRNRALFRSRPVAHEQSSSPSDMQPMSKNPKPPKSQREPELDSLPPFWRTLVLGKSAFADESDFYASIRVLTQIQAAVSELLAPYLKASLLATRRPGAMCDFASTVESGLASVSTDGWEDRPLLEQKSDSTSPLPEKKEFLAQVIEMRGWGVNGAVLRGLMLLAHLDRIGGHQRLMFWLREPNLVLSGYSPIELIGQGKWQPVADLADHLLTSWQPTECVPDE